jgi:hypothetical protein
MVVLILSIVTLGFYGIYWTYCIAEENKQYGGVGPGGLIHLLLCFFVPFAGIYRMVMTTAEIGDMQALNGMPKTVDGTTFFWIFLPIVGPLVRLWKLQGGVNEVWYSKGAPRL